MRKKSSRWMAALPVVLLLASVPLAWLFSQSWPTGNGKVQTDFVVMPGWHSRLVSKKLIEAGLLRSDLAFRILLYATGQANQIKKGIYILHNGMSALDIIDTISSGKTKAVKITIPEGFNNRQIGDLLASQGFFKSREEFLQVASLPALREKFGVPAATLEGYLFPETYWFPLGYPPEKIVEAMLRNFFRQLEQVAGVPSDPQKRHELVILASIVEREAQAKEERALIAGVFANRMQQNYPLESCATIQYLFEKSRPRLYFRDLKINSPYNTYMHSGLPPSPISNPGLPALQAAANPEKTKYKFFVVKGDGTHQFSETFGEHVKAKNQHILKE